MYASLALFPMAAAITAGLSALVALALPRRFAQLDVTFVSLNASIAAWCTVYAVDLAAGGISSPTADGGPVSYALYAAQVAALSATPLLWFSFAARYSGRRRWLAGWRLALIHAPFVYTVAVALTNPWHRLFSTGRVGALAYGPLAVPHQLGTFALVIPGIWMLLSWAWSRGDEEGRRHAIVIGLASVLPLMGGITHATLQALGSPLQVNPVPISFSAFSAVLLYEVLRGGFAGIFPAAVLHAYNGMADAAIITDEAGRITSVNPAAARLIPRAEPGRELESVLPEVAPHVRTCLSLRENAVSFESEGIGPVFYGRATLITDRRGRSLGCLVLLTDITDVRVAQQKLVLAIGEERALKAVANR